MNLKESVNVISVIESHRISWYGIYSHAVENKHLLVEIILSNALFQTCCDSLVVREINLMGHDYTEKIE